MMKWIQVLWPSFLLAGVGALVFFTVIDPQALYFLGEEVHYSSLATYTIGFAAFWLLCAGSSLLTVFLQKDAEAVNQES